MNTNIEIQLTPERFGELLRNFRVKAELTQGDLSKKIGVAIQSVYKWEHGLSFPKEINSLKKIAAMLQMPIKPFLAIKDARQSTRRQNLILNSKDPVIEICSTNFVPIVSGEAKALPLQAIKNPALWTKKRFYLPENLFPGFIFGFEMPDKSMKPLCSPGEVLLVDMREPLREGRPVVVKIKNHAPMCRIYSTNHNTKIFLTGNQAREVRVKSSNIEWCYGVINYAAHFLN